MTIVLSVLLVVCSLAIVHLLRGWHEEYQRAEALADERDGLQESMRLSKAECIGLSDQVAGLTEELSRAKKASLQSAKDLSDTIEEHESAKQRWHAEFVRVREDFVNRESILVRERDAVRRDMGIAASENANLSLENRALRKLVSEFGDQCQKALAEPLTQLKTPTPGADGEHPFTSMAKQEMRERGISVLDAR